MAVRRLRDLADDVLQDTWLTAVRRVRPLRPGGRHISQLAVRDRGQRPPQPAAVPRGGAATGRGRATASLGRKIGPWPTAERAARVAAALAAIPERYEAALRMKYLDRMSVAEIAAACGETEKAVESLLTRARAAFREAYGDD